MSLKQCPCGQIPNELHITTTGQGRKWAQVTGDCCMSWGLDFNTDYQTGQKLRDLATEVWNTATRGWTPITHYLK